MSELRTRLYREETAYCPVGEVSESEKYSRLRENRELAFQVPGAIPLLLRSGPVLWWRTTHSRGDVRTAQHEPVRPGHALRLVGQARTPQRGVEPVPRTVA